MQDNPQIVLSVSVQKAIKEMRELVNHCLSLHCEEIISSHISFLNKYFDEVENEAKEILEKDFGISKYFSYIVLKSPIEKLHYPLTTLFKPDK